MGAKLKKWRRKCQLLQEHAFKRIADDLPKYQEAERKLKQENDALRREVERLRQQLANVGELNAFRTCIKPLPFGRMGGDLYSINVTFDPRMILYGYEATTRDLHLENVSRFIRYTTEELRLKIERELITLLTEGRIKDRVFR